MESKYKVLRVRVFKYNIPCIWNGISQTSKETKKIHGAAQKDQWNLFENGRMTSASVQKNWAKVGNFLKDRLFNDPSYLSLIHQQHIELGKQAVDFSRDVLNKKLDSLPLEELVKLYEELQKHWLDFDEVNVPPWFIGGDYFQAELREKLSKLSDEEFTILITPAERSFSADEELEILELVLKVAKGEDISSSVITKGIEELIKKYFWIPFGYDGPDLYDAKHYQTEILEKSKLPQEELEKKITELKEYGANIKQKQQAVIGKYFLADKEVAWTHQVHVLAIMTDQRKEYAFQLNIALYEIFKALAKKLDLDADDLKQVYSNEVKDNLDNPSVIAEIADRRKNPTLFHFFNGEFEEITGKELEKQKKEIFAVEASDVIKGMVASKGSNPVTSGAVKICLSPQEMGKVEEGDILVATMTTPEYVPAMRKAKAIVTDEGGVTCHAAIVSRELGIPCIIGTKNAIQVLKDGDHVEVNTEKGVVKIIK